MGFGCRQGGQKRKKHKKAVAVNRWSNGAFFIWGLKRGSMSMMKGVLDEGGGAESGQRRILEESNFWPKKRTLFLFQENQEMLH